VGVTNILIFVVAVTIACGGVLAIAEGVINEYRGRMPLQYRPVVRSKGLTDEIQEWLRSQ
jgi:hypothetical protein